MKIITNYKLQITKRVLLVTIPVIFFMIYSFVNSYAQILSPQELIVNGDFSQRYFGFTSEYHLACDDMSTENNYCITSNPYSLYSDWLTCTNHSTNGDSLMMVVNGNNDPKAPSLKIWIEEMKVSANTNYYFSCWFCSIKDIYPAYIHAIINNDTIQKDIFLTLDSCVWVNYNFYWNSGTFTSATISLFDSDSLPNGNDFAIDDISMRAVCSLVADAGVDKIICAGDSTVIGMPVIKGVPPYRVQWTPSTGLNSDNVPMPVASPKTSTTYYLMITDSVDCVSYDTVSVTVLPFPEAKITTNKTSTKICPCDSIGLSAPPGFTYIWSTGDTTQTIYTKLPGTYSATFTNQNLCTSEASIDISVGNYHTAIKIDSIFQAKPGENVVIPIRIVNPIDASCLLGNFKATLTYNQSLLVPINGTPIGTIVNGNQVIDIDATAIPNSNDIYNLNFIATLGNSECTDIKLTQFQWGCNVMKIDTVISGKFCLTGICKEGSTRLFDENSAFYLMQSMPNPASDKIGIEFSVIEDLPSTISIFNSIGEKVANITQINKSGHYIVEYDVSSLPAGVYFYKLETPTQTAIRMFQIIR